MLSKKLCARLLDGSLADHDRYVSGNYNGFNIVMYETNGRSIQVINIPASSDLDPDGHIINNYVNSLIPLYKQFSSANADGRSITMRFRVSTAKKFVEIANDIVSAVVKCLAETGYSASCGNCGRHYDSELYSVNGSYLWLCPECALGYMNRLEERKESTRALNSNFPAGLAGALLGGIAGALLYVIIYRLGFIAGISGFVMAVLAVKLYEKFGGCLDRKGGIACIAVVVIMVFLANKLAWAISAYEALGSVGWSFSECFRELNYIIRESDLTGDYIKDIAVSYIISAVGCASFLTAAIKGSSGVYTFKKLDK